MPNPVNFNVANTHYTNNQVIKTSTILNPGGYVQWNGTLTGMGTGPGSDYEKAQNGLEIDIWYETFLNSGVFIKGMGFVWAGGPYSHAGVTDPPPPFSFQMGDLPLVNFFVQFTIKGNFTVGLASTVS